MWISWLVIACLFLPTQKPPLPAKPIAGISIESPAEEPKGNRMRELAEMQANWVALIPYAFVPRDSATLIFDNAYQWWGERSAGIRVLAQRAKAEGLRRMLKPQAWIPAQYTGDFDLPTEAAWKAFEESYRSYILHYARLAEAEGVELFCLGTEWENFIAKRPQFWAKLIAEVKRVYGGKLTYAANWDGYAEVPFWSELEYIGIDAYFPLSQSKTPSIPELRKAWRPWTAALEKISSQVGKPILFTEYGYCSMDYATSEPWDDNKKGGVNELAQSNAIQALFEELGQHTWYAGGFLWKWHINNSGKIGATAFSVQGKRAESSLRSAHAAFYKTRAKKEAK